MGVSQPEQQVPTPDQTWAELVSWMDAAGNLVELIESNAIAGGLTFGAFQGINDQSTLGVVAAHAGGILVDDWLLILGTGTAEVPGLREVNGRLRGAIAGIPGALVVAIDRLGGAFAINANGLPVGAVGEICYLAPDDLEWMACGFEYGQLIQWAFEGDVESFFGDLRWPSWREESAALGAGRGFNAFPPPWSDEADTTEVSRVPVPIAEAWGVVLSTSLAQGTWQPVQG